MAFVKPTRKILTLRDLELYLASPACALFLEFIQKLNDSVKNIPTTSRHPASFVVASLVEMLEKIKGFVKEIPPVENSKSRFGNPAFRDFYDRVSTEASELLSVFVKPMDAVQEVCGYLVESFGNRQRVDYGTGHEANFLAFLLCLDRLGLFEPTDYTPVVLRVFYGYIDLMRELQFTYWLEPAGSHGVWGLDDYHFLPFLFDHKHIRPKSIHDADVLEQYSKDYMYLACIQFINSIKTASLRWHSPMLDDISGAKSWQKINSGMLKMYHAEVLSKLPIMQHFMFGSLIAFEGASGEEALKEAEAHHGHVHALGQEAPTCCGMKVPSAIAAAAARRGEVELRPRMLPFD